MIEQIQYVEIDLSRCSNDYSVAPCTASIPATGDIKCFNCFATCQDKVNYVEVTATVRYSTATAKPPITIDAVPNIKSIAVRPSKLNLGESIGIRASVNISFKDHRDPDTGPDGDNYLSERPFNPYEQGTYFGRFRARYPFVQNSDIRIITGSTDQTLAQMETRHFIVENMAGPTSSGSFTIQAKDALKLADGKKAQAPSLSSGSLVGNLAVGVTTFTLSPAGIGNDEYPASGILQVGGKEIMSFTRAADVMTVVRAQNNTDDIAHEIGDRVQICLEFDGQDPAQIINDLLVNNANISADLIPLTAWLAESGEYINRLYTGLIAEPTSVTDLINEVLQQTASTIWWDDVNKLIQYRVLRAPGSESTTYNDDLIVAGSFSAKDQPGKRVSQVWTYYGQINPLEDLDEPKNYRTALATVSDNSELSFNGVASIRSIFSRWIPATAGGHAEALNNLILSRYSLPPRLFSFGLQKDSQLITPESAGNYLVENWTVQDETGALNPRPIQIIQVDSKLTGYSVLAEEVLYDDTIAPVDPLVQTISFDTTQKNVNLRAVANGQFTVVDNMTITATVGAGATIYGDIKSGYAMETGDWPATTTLKLIVSETGAIQGRGGDGGAGGSATRTGDIVLFDAGGPGLFGDDAILVEYDLDIDNQGIIYSGGGGGGGGGAAVINQIFDERDYAVTGGGGGGGARNGFGGSAGNLSPASGVGDWTGKMGGAGVAATEIIGGTGGANETIVAEGQTIISGFGGAGGDAGLIGVNGGAGTLNGSFLISGGAGGAIGDAIVQSGGTVTFTNAGDIRGAIV